MTGPALSVSSDAINADAAKIKGVQFPAPSATVNAPCGLAPATSAAEAFNRAAGELSKDQEHLARIKEQIADALERAAKAYDMTDLFSAEAINGGAPSAGIPQMSAAPSGLPAIPSTIGDAAGGDLLNGVCFADDGIYMSIEAGQTAITAPDDCASLLLAMAAWTTNAGNLFEAAAALPATPSQWEGSAATQAYARVAELKQNLTTLAEGWLTLAGRANGFAPAHHSHVLGHTATYEAYKQNEALMKAYPENWQEYRTAMAQQVQAAEEIRQQYAKACELPRGPAPKPQSRDLSAGAPRPGQGISPASWPTTLSNAGGGRPSVTTASENGAQSGANQSGQPSGGAPGDAAQSAASPAQQPQAEKSGEAGNGGQPPSGGMPSGGAPSGGSPSGGGMPGGLPGGMPGAGKNGVKPFSPSVRPASLGKGAGGGAKGAGGAGKGAGGGGRGAGMGGKPLSPAAVAVDAAPPGRGSGAGAGTANAEAGRAPTGGGMGGAGMPMGSHGAGGHGKEKKRSPGLSPDENLYTEDRPWTEAVVGHRRREIPDSGTKDSR